MNQQQQQLLIVLFLIFQTSMLLQHVLCQQNNNIVFDLADLTIDYETETDWFSLEAFKSSIKDIIVTREKRVR